MHDPREDQPEDAKAQPSEFLDSLKKGALAGGLLLLLVLPFHLMRTPDAPQPEAPVATGPQSAPADAQERAASSRRPTPGLRLADFRSEDVSPDTRHVANWVVHTDDAKNHAFVIIDKKDARVYVFSPDGKLQESAPALLGSARGDDSFPGIGEKPLSQIRDFEKTTPAGRFIAEPGVNTNNEDIVWVDYDAAVSMHRIRPNNAKERRLERMASLAVDDNRISFGCVNLPVSFYENILSPTVQKFGAIVYVLPETRSVQQVFGSYDVLSGAQQAGTPARREALERVALRSSDALKPRP